jgi:tetratricopeptide (TPR) repeat protein
MRYKIVACALLIGAAVAAPVLGGDDAGTISPFGLGAGGRGIAMGGAGAAVWGDSYSLFWNPAGLHRIEYKEANLFHTSLFDESATYSALALSHPFLELGVFSFGVVQLRVGGIEQRDASNMLLDGELRNVQTRYALGYAREITKGFSVGVDAKLDRFSQGSYSASGLGLDLGAGIERSVQSRVLDGIAIGLTVMNVIEPTMKLAERESGDPRGVLVGGAMWKSISRKMQDRLMIVVDVEKSQFSDAGLHIGAEYRVRDAFAARGGWDDGIPTLGCGVEARRILFDYAYRSTELGGNHLFSLSMRFGASRSEERERAQRARDEEMQRELETRIASYENRSIAAALDEGHASLARGDYAGALDRFRGVLLWSPSNEQAQDGVRRAGAALAVARGDSLVTKGRYVEALLSYREAQENLVSETTAQRILQCEQRIQELSNTERMKDEMLAAAIDLYTNRKWEDAASGFTEVLALEPGHELARTYLTRTREQMQERHERALADADRLAADGRFAAAAQVLARELERRPDDERIKAKIAEVALLQKNTESAKSSAAAKALPALLSTAERERLRPAYERGIQFLAQADFARAIAEWEGVYRVDPRFEQVAGYLVKAYQYLGMECYARHEYERALEIWNRILVVDPNNEKAIRYITKTREELSKLEGYTSR